MNREIKFRVWTGERMEYSVGVSNHGAFYCGGIDSNDSASLGFTTLYSKEYPVLQYTGLKDKNGKDVYEGDIVKIHRCYTRPFINEKNEIDYKLIDEGEVEIGQIFWGCFSQRYLVSYEHIRYDDTEDFDKSSHRVEVIGNIFENPELLK